MTQLSNDTICSRVRYWSWKQKIFPQSDTKIGWNAFCAYRAGRIRSGCIFVSSIYEISPCTLAASTAIFCNDINIHFHYLLTEVLVSCFSMQPMGMPNGPMPPMPMQMMQSSMPRMPANMPVKPLFPAAGQVQSIVASAAHY